MMRRTARYAACGIAALLVSLVSVASAQTAPARAGSLKVTAIDPSGGAITSATITVTDADGAVLSASTNARGEATFDPLPSGRYTLRVEASGFEPQEVASLSIRTGRLNRDVKMNLARLVEQVDVRQSDADKRLTDAFSTSLTPDQIAQLPDDPDELEQVLRDMAGPDSRLRINGFTGGRLPPKSQIREIRFRFDPYSAEMHDAGHPNIDITTKPGLGSWRNAASYAFRDESLNARNAFAPTKGAEQTRRVGWSLDGPLVKDKTSFSFALDTTNAFDSKTIVAAQPDGYVNDVVQQPNDRVNVTARVEHAFNAAHLVRGEFQRSSRAQDNLGVGDFNLTDRAYAQDQRDMFVRLSESGTFRKKYMNQARLQVRWQRIDYASRIDATTINVLNAFTSGGAQVEGGRRLMELQLADEIEFSVGRSHAVRGGVLLETGRYESDERRNAIGSFTFASLDDYVAGRPTTFTQRTGDPFVGYSQSQLGVWIEDSIRARKNLILTLGLRHEGQTHVDDWNNLAPRFGVTWSPFKSNKTTLRAGGGVFYGWFDSSLYEQTLKVDGRRQEDLFIQQPGYPDPYAGGAAEVLPTSIVRSENDLILPVTRRASIGVEQQLTTWARLRVNYFSQHDRSVLRSRNANAPVNDARPYPGIGVVSQIESTARGSNQGLDVGLNVSYMPRRLMAAVNYLLASSMNEADTPLALPANSRDLASEWGPSRMDSRHRVFALFNTNLAKGFGMGANLRFQSALPYTITTGYDDNGDTVSNDRPAGVGRNSARGSSTRNLDVRLSWSRGFGHRDGQTPGGPTIVVRRIGDDSGDALGGLPNVGDLQAAVRMELYAQVFNVFNDVNYINYTGVMTSPFFGTATAAQAPRRMEVGIRFSF